MGYLHPWAEEGFLHLLFPLQPSLEISEKTALDMGYFLEKLAEGLNPDGTRETLEQQNKRYGKYWDYGTGALSGLAAINAGKALYHGLRSKGSKAAIPVHLGRMAAEGIGAAVAHRIADKYKNEPGFYLGDMPVGDILHRLDRKPIE